MSTQADSQATSPALTAGCMGLIGGLCFWALFLFFIFAFPDPQSGIGLALSPFLSAAFGLFLAIAAWGAISVRRGKAWAILVMVPAAGLVLLLFWWFLSEIAEML